MRCSFIEVDPVLMDLDFSALFDWAFEQAFDSGPELVRDWVFDTDLFADLLHCLSLVYLDVPRWVHDFQVDT